MFSNMRYLFILLSIQTIFISSRYKILLNFFLSIFF
nr:MAG TPA: hypothetical protein [Caudoviricetes sp.]